MKAKIIIEYEGNFTEQDLKDEVKFIEDDINNLDNSFEEPKFDTFKISYKILKK